MEVLPKKKYCEQSGETIKAVNARIDRGIWIEGVHYHKIDKVREHWIDIKAIESWARNGGKSLAA